MSRDDDELRLEELLGPGEPLGEPLPARPGRPRPLVRLLLFIVGLATGFFAGYAWGIGYVEWENGTTDLSPPVTDWHPVWWVLIASWLLALGIACFSRRLRWLGLGWLLGLPVLPVIAWTYAYVVFGQWGEAPLP